MQLGCKLRCKSDATNIKLRWNLYAAYMQFRRNLEELRCNLEELRCNLNTTLRNLDELRCNLEELRCNLDLRKTKL